MDLSVVSKLQSFCSYRDRSSFETRRKALSIGMNSEDWIEIESHLFSEGFLNDQRFTENFIRSKIKHNSWGRLKIQQALSLHKIDKEIVSQAWAIIDSTLYEQTLRLLLANKWSLLNTKTSLDRKQSCIRFALSKGFDLDEILSAFKQLKLE